jgi:hypothetical protein
VAPRRDLLDGGGSRTVLPVLLAVVALAGCARGSSTGDDQSSAALPPGQGRSIVVGSAAACSPPPTIVVEDLAAKLPPGLTMPAGSRLLQVDETNGATTVIGETTTAISPLLALFRRQLLAAGREIFSEDNEGHEAELYFTLPGRGYGVVRETKARCPIGVTRFSIES